MSLKIVLSALETGLNIKETYRKHKMVVDKVCLSHLDAVTPYFVFVRNACVSAKAKHATHIDKLTD